MIPNEEIGGLLAEADHAEATGANGGMVLLTPEYTRHLMGILRAVDLTNDQIEYIVTDYAHDWNAGFYNTIDSFVRSVVFGVLEVQGLKP